MLVLAISKMSRLQQPHAVALDIVLPWLSEERVRRLCSSALEIYVKDRIGTEN